MKRTLNAEVPKSLNENVTVSGWAETVRSHGKIIFIDLRDASGILQLVFTPKNESAYKEAQRVKPEWVLSVEGKVQARPKEMVNSKIETGGVELSAEKIEVLSEAKTLPFEISLPKEGMNEETRLKYRYLDLRREKMQKNMIFRQKVTSFMRSYLEDKGFVEIETPILTKSTPEGARDFLVPSRLYAEKFYALPQSPQQYKQLLMVAGFEKYFQIARCFRDEDPRADRQPEFTQLDIEMSFCSQEEIMGLIEDLYTKLVKKIFPAKKIMQEPFPVITYKEAMEKYNSDKPDLRQDKNDPDELAFGFVVDFPMFEWKEKEKRWDAVHHPFTRPQTDDIEQIKKDPGKVLAFQYDFVLNGYEIGGGSLRTYKPEMLEAVFSVMGHTKEDLKEKFGHLFEAFEYGVPPHGGIAPGIDRFMSIILNEPNIREVIAFPKTGDNRDLMMEAPSKVGEDQLKELNIKTLKAKK